MARLRKYILLVPLIVVLIPVAAIILLVMGLWQWALILLFISFGFNWLSETFALHIAGKTDSDPGDVRVLTYNVNRAHEISVNKGTTNELIILIEQQDADIVLLQEYNVELYPEVREKLLVHYPYELGTEKGSRFKSVFSKYPIEEYEQLLIEVDDSRYEFLKHEWYCNSRGGIREVLPICSMVVRVGDKRIRLVNCHLMTNNFSVVIRNTRRDGKSVFRAILPVMEGLDYGYAARKIQAEIVCQQLSGCKEGFFVVCGDFNDISGSSTLIPFRKLGMKDAWWKGGLGFGFTFHGMGLRLRLDHVLYSASSLHLKRVYIPYSECSDHDPIICDFKIL